ncbi:UNVERIFIED_CONTAM: hypothetical protein FKN15_069445 [Acipenser sinensis]
MPDNISTPDCSETDREMEFVAKFDFPTQRPATQPPQRYSIGGPRSSGQLTGRPAGARQVYRGRWCAPPLGSLIKNQSSAQSDTTKEWFPLGPTELQAQIGHRNILSITTSHEVGKLELVFPSEDVKSDHTSPAVKLSLSAELLPLNLASALSYRRRNKAAHL